MVCNAKRLFSGRLKTKFTKNIHTEIELTKEKEKYCRRYMAWKFP